ncbi:DUF1217 domain-containing protein [Methylobacterium sp. 1030]|uniref:DUF1217 domain-containing protein n=1 Tax=Methylobacterium sp. 1030 TaxID=3156404 RepID=UPI00339B062A
MSSTFTEYRLIAGNMTKALERKASEGSVRLEIEYFKSHIETVGSIDEFLADNRLYGFAMRAYGLDDMIYAKGFMKKALAGGIEDANSFANRLSDSRYKEFVAAFNFAKYGDKTTTWSNAGKATISAYTQTMGSGADANDEGAQLRLYFEKQSSKIASVTDILADQALMAVVRTALGLPASMASASVAAQAALIEGKLDVASLQNSSARGALLDKFTAAFKTEKAATKTGTWSETETGTLSGYVRQTLEADAGSEDEGVRLALYFKRKAPEIKSTLSILGDKALAEVVRTALGLPAEMAQGDIDAQVAAIDRKLDVASLQDPAAVDKFIRRFTALWDVQNDTVQSSTLTLFGASRQDLDTDLLLKLQNIRLGAR